MHIHQKLCILLVCFEVNVKPCVHRKQQFIDLMDTERLCDNLIVEDQTTLVFTFRNNFEPNGNHGSTCFRFGKFHLVDIYFIITKRNRGEATTTFFLFLNFFCKFFCVVQLVKFIPNIFLCHNLFTYTFQI
ncbi:hypothetical protein SDC9_90018 [bioreactor metagenome]|uniref:Uncharacterized protein n=1 Tax=bioreactor metagenome TaxID=1076179 RepID=A0A644ZR27_9ZZZZ